jgi:hypothetical protein
MLRRQGMAVWAEGRGTAQYGFKRRRGIMLEMGLIIQGKYFLFPK